MDDLAVNIGEHQNVKEMETLPMLLFRCASRVESFSLVYLFVPSQLSARERFIPTIQQNRNLADLAVLAEDKDATAAN